MGNSGRVSEGIGQESARGTAIVIRVPVSRVSYLSYGRRHHPTHHPALLLSLLGLALLGAGCSSQGRPTLKLVSLDKKPAAFTQRFSHAYASRSDDGEYDLVLVKEVEVPPAVASAGDDSDAVPAAAAAGVPSSLRQLMHVRVLWRPRRGVRGNASVTANASIRWYVVGDSGRGTEALEYAGTGSVT